MAIPYLHFQGDCEEAFARYAEIFGGKVKGLSRFTEETGGPELAGKVMHAEVSLGKWGELAGADQLEPVEHGKAVDLLVHNSTVEEAQRLYDGLAKGGVEICRLTPHPPPDDAGMGGLVRDAYGFLWIITSPNPDKA